MAGEAHSVKKRHLNNAQPRPIIITEVISANICVTSLFSVARDDLTGQAENEASQICEKCLACNRLAMSLKLTLSPHLLPLSLFTRGIKKAYGD